MQRGLQLWGNTNRRHKDNQSNPSGLRGDHDIGRSATQHGGERRLGQLRQVVLLTQVRRHQMVQLRSIERCKNPRSRVVIQVSMHTRQYAP